ncbi:MAG: lactoylglutathione lyase, partial [Planctomycetes bacterium]|nr:lactoylglutathione lyase [Planctomycetota bacterium]
MARAEFILYVEDPSRARDFYRVVLGADPVLDVPGMTEFALGPETFLGLMPKAGIARLITP